jgi:hypothetical protein
VDGWEIVAALGGAPDKGEGAIEAAEMSAAFVGPDFVLLTYMSNWQGRARLGALRCVQAQPVCDDYTTTGGNLGQRRPTGLRRWTIVPRSPNFAQMRPVIVLATEHLAATWQRGQTSG